MKKLLLKFVALLGLFLFLGSGSAKAVDVYFLSDQFGWSGNNDNKLFLESGTEYSRTFPYLNEGAFKINDGEWRGQTGDAGMRGGDSWTLNGGNNVKFANSLFNVKLTYDTSTKLLKITGPGKEGWALHGQFVSDTWGPIFFTNNSGTVWKTEPVSVQSGTKSFGLAKYDANANQTAWYSNSGNLTSNNSTLTLSSNGSTNPTFNLSANKEYIFTWDTSNNKLSVEEAPTVSPWQLQASYTDQNKIDRTIDLEQSKSNSNLWSATFQANSEDGWSQFAIYDTQNKKAYSLNDLTLSDLSVEGGPLTDWPTSSNQDKSHFRLTADKTYTLTFNSSDKKVSLSYEGEPTYPQTMNVTGYVNGITGWAADNVVEMTRVDDGIFKVNNLVLTQGALINFCANKGINSADWNGQRPQFGAPSKDNPITFTDGIFTSDILEVNSETPSFVADAGHYDITLSLVDMTISVTKNEPVALSWIDTKENKISGNEFKGTHKTNHTLTLNINDNSGHAAIEDVKISVEKQASLKNVKRYAKEETDDYEIDNNVITFKKAGTYQVTASLDDAEGYHSAEPLVLTANIAALDVTENSDLTAKAWDKENLDFTVLTIESSVVTEDDFEISVAPKYTPTPYPTTRPDNFIEWAWDQMEGIRDSNPIDGYYPLTNPTYTHSVQDNGLVVTGHFPESGSYTVTVTSKDESVTIDGQTSKDITVNVTPNPALTYSDYTVTFTNEKGQTETSKIEGPDGININGMQINGGSIEYPYNETDGLWGDVTNARFYTPGIYNATVKYVLSDTNIDTTTTADFQTMEGQTINISRLAETTPLYLYFFIEKNGVASEVEPVTLIKSTTIPTAVDSIEASEEGEAVYYNLQGVRVENPEHGIFVKVVNGKATKVVK